VDTPARTDLVPAGVEKESWDTLLYGVTAQYYLAPPGADPQSALTTWFQELSAGEPYTAQEARALRILQQDKSAIGIPMPKGGPAPTAIQSGWTDSLFPVSEAMHYANRVNGANRVHATGDRTPMLLMFDDVGHGWAQDKPADVNVTDALADDFLSSVMLTHDPAPGTRVVALRQTCPATAPSGAPVSGPTLRSLAPYRLRLTGRAAQVVTSSGGDPAVAAALDPATAKLCDPMPSTAEPGTATYRRPVGAKAVTMTGGVVVRARLRITGRYPELVGRLWDVSPNGSRQIVAMGVYRPSATGQVRFELNPNDYRFAPGHTIELELVGSNAPYFRASNGSFRIRVSDLTATLPIS
jgi:hypothetical protein